MSDPSPRPSGTNACSASAFRPANGQNNQRGAKDLVFAPRLDRETNERPEDRTSKRQITL